MSGGGRFVFFFGDGASEGDPARVDLLGGKGASLAAMSRAGFPVPPGFTISAECCALAEAHGGRWPDGLEEEVGVALVRLERATNRAFAPPSVGRVSDPSAINDQRESRADADRSAGGGDRRGNDPCGRVGDPSYGRTDDVPCRPLLVAVRSGAGVSMPGMMDTILNCGLTPAHAAASPHLWHDLAEHVRMFAASVAGLKLDAPPDDPNEPDADRRQALAWIDAYERHTGRAFPTDPWESLCQCIDAVFASWHSDRARAYRAHHDVRGLPGTAVNVQSMFPSERSGVLFTVDPQRPDSGEMILEASYGLGEAVVSGAVTPDIYAIDRETLAVRRATAGQSGTMLRIVSDVPSTHEGAAQADGRNDDDGRVGDPSYRGGWQSVGWVFDPSADAEPRDSQGDHHRPADGSDRRRNVPCGRVGDPSYGTTRSVVASGCSTRDAPSASQPALGVGQTDETLSHDARRGASCHTLCLTEAQVREIAALGRRVEQHFGVPSDIEWGIADGRVALLQTRAIRGLDVLRAAEELRRTEPERLTRLAGDRHVVWAAHNLGETLPHPTPLTWSVVRWFMSGDGGFGRLYRLLGFRPSDEVCRSGFLELIAGRIYVDPTRAARLFWGVMPFEYDAAEILADRQTLERPPTKLDFAQADPFLFLKLPGLLWAMGRSSRTMRRMRARTTSDGRRVVPARDRFERDALPQLERFLTSCGQFDLKAAPFETLLSEFDRRVEFVLGDFAAESLLPGFFAGVALEELQRWLTQIFGTDRGTEQCRRLTAGLDGDVTIEQNQRLYEAANASSATVGRVFDPSADADPRESQGDFDRPADGGDRRGGVPCGRVGDPSYEDVRQFVGRVFDPSADADPRESQRGFDRPADGGDRRAGVPCGRVGDPSYGAVNGAGSLADFLRDFGHRAAEEMELAQPRWREDASFLERMMAGLRRPSANDSSGTRHDASVPQNDAAGAREVASPAARHAEQARIRHEAEVALPGLLQEFGASSLRETIAPLLAEAQALLPFRETGKFHLMRGYETIRAVLVEIARRFDFGRDLFFLERSELRDLPTRAGELRSFAAQRKTQWQAAKKLFVSDIIDSKNLADFGRPPTRALSADGHFTARPIAGGVARGPARIVFSPSDAGDLGTGYILVCPSTDPGWTPLFLHCKGLIVERGGTLSHGAIVARDFGIPAVVLEDATRLIPDGTTVEIDATAGVVVLAPSG